jgi:hypothetical protein
MAFTLRFTPEAARQLERLEKSKDLQKRLKAVRRSLAYLEKNPRHQSLHTHKYSSIQGLNNEEVFEAYAENQTPAAYRIFWHYGPGGDVITIVAITSHP